MTVEILDWVCGYLERDDEIIVPMKRMWNDWRAGHGEPSLGAFTALVLADERIESMGDAIEAEPAGLSPEAAEKNVRQSEAIGLYSGPQVKLKSREITQEHIARMLQKQNERIMSALDQVIEALPGEVGEEEEGENNDAMSLMRQLRRSLANDPEGEEDL